jgi:hypothetical protein
MMARQRQKGGLGEISPLISRFAKAAKRDTASSTRVRCGERGRESVDQFVGAAVVR